MELTYSRIEYSDLHDVFEIEMNVYSPGSRPGVFFTRDTVRYCNDLTMIARDENGVAVGVVYGKLINGPELTDEKVNARHDPDGDTLTCCSLSVRKDLQGVGLADKLIRHYYYNWINGDNGTNRDIKHVSIITTKNLIKWSENVGFTLIGESKVTLAGGPWFYLTMDF
jgi:hypothetical protein